MKILKLFLTSRVAIKALTFFSLAFSLLLINVLDAKKTSSPKQKQNASKSDDSEGLEAKDKDLQEIDADFNRQAKEEAIQDEQKAKLKALSAKDKRFLNSLISHKKFLNEEWAMSFASFLGDDSIRNKFLASMGLEDNGTQAWAKKLIAIRHSTFDCKVREKDLKNLNFYGKDRDAAASTDSYYKQCLPDESFNEYQKKRVKSEKQLLNNFQAALGLKVMPAGFATVWGFVPFVGLAVGAVDFKYNADCQEKIDNYIGKLPYLYKGNSTAQLGALAMSAMCGKWDTYDTNQ